LCPTAAAILGDEPRPGFDAAAAAGRRAAEELSFGSDTRCGPEYRRAICPVLLRRAILEAAT
ncbi:MAG TPA: molybdopterin dehydrogenase, partial [Rectinemataceae bacterium]